MNKTRKIIILVAILVLACVAAEAGSREVSETFAADPDGTISIELIAGSVRFVGWERDEVQITGRLGDDVEGLDIESTGKRTMIEVALIDSVHGAHNANAELEIHVPSGSRVEAEAISADLEVESVRGRVSIESVSGKVRIRGDVTEAEVSTVASSILVDSDTELRSGQFETVAGKIDFRGALSPNGRFSFESMSGSVTLRLPTGTSAEFDVETFSGDIDNELGPQARRTAEYGPGKSLRFSMGSGGARVSIESFSGHVKLLSH
jgi:DUF4097 and DUF4098 domain-containing protein YvlB